MLFYLKKKTLYGLYLSYMNVCFKLLQHFILVRLFIYLGYVFILYPYFSLIFGPYPIMFIIPYKTKKSCINIPKKAVVNLHQRNYVSLPCNPGFTDEAQMDRLVHPKMKILENN